MRFLLGRLWRTLILTFGPFFTLSTFYKGHVAVKLEMKKIEIFILCQEYHVVSGEMSLQEHNDNLHTEDVTTLPLITHEHIEKHIRTPTGEKPFSCDVCGKSFSQKCRLKDHQLTHTGEFPFSCSLCEFKCWRKSDLTGHMRAHKGE